MSERKSFIDPSGRRQSVQSQGLGLQKLQDNLQMQFNRLVHPSDWRNIPACVVSTSSYLIDKQNSFDKEFKNFIT